MLSHKPRLQQTHAHSRLQRGPRSSPRFWGRSSAPARAGSTPCTPPRPSPACSPESRHPHTLGAALTSALASRPWASRHPPKVS